jgi:hypothetical protein
VVLAACAETTNELASRVRKKPVVALPKHSRRRIFPAGVR